MAENQSRFNTLYLSAKELKGLTQKSGAQWPDALIQDYLTILENTAVLASDSQVMREDINKNTGDIAALVIVVDGHILSESAHGVSGDNVGTEDFASGSVGGVVLLSGFQSQLLPITTPDIGSAPVNYDQAYTQSVTDLVNENKNKINDIISKVNSIITGQISSKQMAAS